MNRARPHSTRTKSATEATPILRPEYERVSSGVFLLRITDTQLTKSTINAYKVIRQCLEEGGLVNFKDIGPGEKIFRPCTLSFEGSSEVTKVSLLIPMRRGETQPEPRMWPYKLRKRATPGMRLWFVVEADNLEIRDTEP